MNFTLINASLAQSMLAKQRKMIKIYNSKRLHLSLEYKTPNMALKNVA